MPKTFVIVGASLAGATAAATLRKEGFDGRVVLIGEERHAPYERPPLSKEYLRGEQPFENSLVHLQDFYSSNDIETRWGIKATRLDTGQRKVELVHGDPISYDSVLITTGSRNRRFPIPGLDLEGIYDLRTVDDADRIKAELIPGRRAAIVGMGFIGSEVAASLRSAGVEVVGIEMERLTLSRALGDQVGKVIGEIHRDHCVELIMGERVMAFEGTGRVERIVTDRGRKIECDFAVVGLGVVPVTDIVHGTNVHLDNGIVVDEFCRTNIEGVFAAGDVTNHFHPGLGQRMRLEHWHNALNQGAVAAQNMMGLTKAHDEIPWFWSDQYDHKLEYVGFARDWDNIVVRGSLKKRDFVAFYLNSGLISAAVGMNRGKDIRRAEGLIKSKAFIEPEQLEEDDLALLKLTVPSRS